ncbi:hypothetical protein PILCRDRAFT_827659 [Piloderma croceum F 1598]|uniref:Uncharacterized protein n=1 Tax=Piloderma croceum (strain F 1598) TaxID=765440 RepID=A0A0C3F508_PILCF|nr:hypothetical protein PILCRDRAFT_827659 [Piloderma croceum F 1598]
MVPYGTIQSDLPFPPHIGYSTSVLALSIHAIATPAPTLLFAIAGDDVAQVNQVLESGNAEPNDQIEIVWCGSIRSENFRIESSTTQCCFG